jgi:hypothetical protein
VLVRLTYRGKKHGVASVSDNAGNVYSQAPRPAHVGELLWHSRTAAVAELLVTVAFEDRMTPLISLDVVAK